VAGCRLELAEGTGPGSPTSTTSPPYNPTLLRKGAGHPPESHFRAPQGQAGQIVSVNDDVAEPDGHAGSRRGTVDRIPGTRYSAAGGSITGGHATR
jgi:hypothetical protein